MLLWIEGFESFGTSGVPAPTGIVARKYATIGEESAMLIRPGRIGGYGIVLNDNPTCYLSPGALTTDATLVIGCAYKFPSVYPVDGRDFIQLYDGATLGINLKTGIDGQLSICLGASVIETSTTITLVAGTWYYLELKVVCGDAGSYELRINNTVIFRASGVGTKAGSHDYHTTFSLCGTTWAEAYGPVWDDVYCLDGSGSANNDFLGDMNVTTLRPLGAGSSTELTPDTGSNYARVSESVCDDDTSYVEGSVGTKDLYEYDPIPNPGVIAGVMVVTDCRNMGGPSLNMITACESGGTDDDDAGQVVSAITYGTLKRVIELDPHTSAAWLKAGLNSAQFGVEVG